MTIQEGSSQRFLYQSIANAFVCKKVETQLQEMVPKQAGVPPKSYLYVLLLAVALLSVNQILFFSFKTSNIFQICGVSRKWDAKTIHAHFRGLVSHARHNLNSAERANSLKILEEQESILTHPARRLMYDEFNEQSTEYAWAFKSQQYLVGQIISSSIFYIICTIIGLLTRSSDAKKDSIKIDLSITILLFLIEVDLIISAEQRQQNPTDLLDDIYPAFTMHERRCVLSSVLIPLISIVQFYMRYCTRSPSEKKLLSLAGKDGMRTSTMKIRAKLEKITERTEEKIEIVYEENKRDLGEECRLYREQRELIRKVMVLEGTEIMMRQDVRDVLNYFLLLP